jgi:hypothetical protein
MTLSRRLAAFRKEEQAASAAWGKVASVKVA